MNDIFLTLGIESWKPFVAALLLPPVPLLILMLMGARLMFRRRILAWLLVLLAVAGLWFSCTTALSMTLQTWLLKPPPALTEAQINDLKKAPRTAIVVLGGGRKLRAPEYALSTLHERGIERLRFGVWLSRETGLPIAFSGGVGHGADGGTSEAEIAARIAEREFGRPLKWTETESRDTRENAMKTVPLLQAQGIEQLVLVTHGYHMPRALRNFERADLAGKLRLVPAPVGLPPGGRMRVGDWLPSAEGFEGTRLVLHEWVGRLAGA
jgi:uncharacterized SAM-binding protein YcdF (DUF218 family)